MSLLAIGSVALDSVETPFGSRPKVLGGSGTHFSMSASYFTPLDLIAVVGEDFPEEYIQLLKSRGVGLDGLEKAPGKTFHWKGKYEYDLNSAITLETQLGVFETFDPKIPPHLSSPDFLFLANIDPKLQRSVLEKMKKRPKLVALDTMNFWIQGQPDVLKSVISKVDLLIINEGEARQLTSENNLVRAWKKIFKLGPKTLIIKQGEYGALMFQNDQMFSIPALPLEEIKDPTGAGDSFAGGVMGYLAKTHQDDWNSLKKAIIFGSAMASFNVEDFSCERLKDLDSATINGRVRQFQNLASFETPLL